MKIKRKSEPYYPWRHPFPGCADNFCRGTNQDGTEVRAHRTCISCRRPTCKYKILVDPATLRRKGFPLCSWCPEPAEQKSLRAQRTLRDWTKVTDPVEADLLAEEMGEQYSSRVRAALRAFMDSGFEEATVPVATNIAQESIRVLGLQDIMYAEQRDKSTVLRRII